MELAELTANRLLPLLNLGEISCRDVMESILRQIQIGECELKICSYITIRAEKELLAEAEDFDKRRKRGEPLGPLAGLPIAIKDNICTEGIRTTCASKILDEFIPPYNATAVEKLLGAGGIIVGKTNLDEFAMGSSTENSYYKKTRNPHDLSRVPGGTSGGSAAALAANETVLAIGSDTGGSIRQPASFCGVVGVKPTYGRVSRYGLIAYASSFDQIGPMARNVHDAALLLTVLAGHDPRDSTSLKQPVPNLLNAAQADGVMRIGVPQEYFGDGLDSSVRASVDNAIGLFREGGHEIVSVSLPHTAYAVPAYYVCASAEASSNLARYDGMKYGYRAPAKDLAETYMTSRSQGFGAEVKRRILLGTYVLSAGYYDAYYLKAMRVRTLIARDFENAFAKCDVLVHPVAPTPAFKIGEKTDDPLAMYLGDVYSVVANLVGFPAISIPCGKSNEGLPIGIQIAAKCLDEMSMFRAAFWLEGRLAETQSGFTMKLT